MPAELPKAYDPKDAQGKWLRVWDEKGYFHSEPDPARKPFTIVIPLSADAVPKRREPSAHAADLERGGRR